MAYKNFRKNCVIRVVSLGASLFLFTYLLSTEALYATIILTGLAILVQIYTLIRFVEKTNRDFTRFLSSIEYSDFTQNITTGMKGTSFDELNDSFDKVVSRFRQISLEKEENFRYLQTIVQHIGVGIIAFDGDGKVDLLNTSAKRLLGVSHLRNISALDDICPPILEKLRTIEPGNRDLSTIRIDDEMLQLSLYAAELRQRGRMIKLVSIQNISMELNEKEMDAWQNLIRVLTHEIKNSLAPIGSLASSVEEMLLPPDLQGDMTVSCEAKDIRTALQTIQKRSHGLLQFVDTYRDLTHIPNPEYSTFPLSDIFQTVEKLILSQYGKIFLHRTDKPSPFSWSIEPYNLELTADQKLLEQVIINLVVNSIQATEKMASPEISIHAGIDDRGRAFIEVSDNGPGINSEALDKVFIPFFSTKKEGSGVGLSLSRQIMRMHRGDLTVRSNPGVETVFRMRF